MNHPKLNPEQKAAASRLAKELGIFALKACIALALLAAFAPSLPVSLF